MSCLIVVVVLMMRWSWGELCCEKWGGRSVQLEALQAALIFLVGRRWMAVVRSSSWLCHLEELWQLDKT